MIKKILLVLVGLIVAFLIVVQLQPSNYKVTRTAVVRAEPAAVFPLVNDFHQWDKWSPWAKLDPNMKTEYTGAPMGKGAHYHWVGNDQVGEGRMTIEESRPNEYVGIKLEFLKPFPSNSQNSFSFKPDPAGTAVEWSMAGDADFMTKMFCLFMGGMDKAIGPDFEKGLAQMKAAAETRPAGI
jgi:hypothetical protein